MTIFKVPLIIRGEVIEDYTIEHAGRKGGVSFVTPDITRYMRKLTAQPRDLLDLYRVSLDEILDFLVEFGQRFNLHDNRHMQEAFEISVLTSGMTEPVLRGVYSGFDRVCNKAYLQKYVEMAVGSQYLEGWVPTVMGDGSEYNVRAFGARAVHVIAGNSPKCAFITLLRNAITRSDAIIKLPSNDPLTAIAALKTMIDIDPDHPLTRHVSAGYWKGGDEAVEASIYTPRHVEKIVAWGGFNSIKHITRYLQPGLDLITMDPKHSAAIIGREALDSDEIITEVARRAACDAGAFNQELCANARIVYAHCDPDNAADMARLNQLGEQLYQAMQELPEELSTPAKYGVPELEEGIQGLAMEDDFYKVYRGAERCGAVIVSQTDEPVEFANLLACRTVNIVPVADLDDILKRMSADTQTIGIYPPALRLQIRDRLGFQGAQHLIDLGYLVRMQFVGPTDALEAERRMLKWVKDISIDMEYNGKPWLKT